MSEFSESYHFRDASQVDAAASLRAANLKGWVYTPTGRWTTVVPDLDFRSSPMPSLLTAYPGESLYYMNAEDHGWRFAIWREGASVLTYRCEWDTDIDIGTSALSAAQFASLLAPFGVEGDLQWLLDETTVEAALEEGDNPADRFAQAIGLTHYEWLSGSYLRSDGGPEDAAALRIG